MTFVEKNDFLIEILWYAETAAAISKLLKLGIVVEFE